MKKQAPKNQQNNTGQLPLNFTNSIDNSSEATKIISITRSVDRVRNSLLAQIIHNTKSF
jgi:hypothetical protein